MRFWFALGLGLMTAAPAVASDVVVVDFQRAVQETTEGKAAQQKLEQMRATREGEITRMKAALDKRLEDYQARQMILSAEARRVEEETLMMEQQRFQEKYVQYQQEMQQNYMGLLQGLDTKMRDLSATIAKDKGYQLVLDRAAVVYIGPDYTDMTDELIRRYNAQQ